MCSPQWEATSFGASRGSGSSYSSDSQYQHRTDLYSIDHLSLPHFHLFVVPQAAAWLATPRIEDEQQETVPRYISQARIDLDDLDPEKNDRAIKKLEESTHSAAQDVLVNALDHSSRNIRIKAAVALAQVTNGSDTRTVPGLVEAFVYETGHLATGHLNK